MIHLLSRLGGILAASLVISAGSAVVAQGLFTPDTPSLQEERDVRSTYIVRLEADLPANAVEARANAIAAQFGGQIRYVYSNTFNGFAITLPSVAMANMQRAQGLGITAISPDGIATISGKPTTNPGKGGSGGDTTSPTCSQSIPWGVAALTNIYEDPNDPCQVLEVPVGSTTPVVPNYGTASAPQVCVLDTGVDIDHPDLNVDASHHYNFSSDKTDDDLHGHGTHVSGTIGAIGNNGIGVVGVAPNASIVPVKVLNRRGSGRYSDIIAAIDTIADMSGRSAPLCAVANMSLGGSNNNALVAAVRCASARDANEATARGCSDAVIANPAGITFTIAAGNSAVDATDYSPANASYNASDNIHTIAAMDSDSVWAYFSNYGVPPVDYIEPGVAVESTFKDGGYKTYSGTSMAAPHMAGLVLRDLVNGTSFASGGTVSGPDGDYTISVDAAK